MPPLPLPLWLSRPLRPRQKCIDSLNQSIDTTTVGYANICWSWEWSHLRCLRVTCSHACRNSCDTKIGRVRPTPACQLRRAPLKYIVIICCYGTTSTPIEQSRGLLIQGWHYGNLMQSLSCWVSRWCTCHWHLFPTYVRCFVIKIQISPWVSPPLYNKKTSSMGIITPGKMNPSALQPAFFLFFGMALNSARPMGAVSDLNQKTTLGTWILSAIRRMHPSKKMDSSTRALFKR